MQITLEIDSVDDQQCGPSFWKFNNSLLDDVLFVERLRKTKLISVMILELNGTG